MNTSYALVLVAALIGPGASAQAGPTQTQTTEQLVCQLSNDCAPSTVSADKEKDKSASRGFSIYRPTAPAKASAAKMAASPVARLNRQAAVAEPRGGRAAGHLGAARPTPVGRAELMVNFVTGSAELSTGSRGNAMALLGAVNAPQLAGKRFAIEGHTDSVGTHAANLDLSQRRAQAVVDFLTKNGVDSSRFDVRGYGPDKPIDGLSARDGRNRRVEIVLIK